MKRETGNFIQPTQVTTHKSKQGVTLETSISQTPIGTSPTAMEQPAQRGISSPTSSGTSPPTGAPHTSIQASADQLTSVKPSTAATQATPTSQARNQSMTTSKEITTTKPETKHNHTNKTSLVIALFFGILFLCGVIIIVGKPWWEFMQRPRYSKVDYLMNGL